MKLWLISDLHLDHAANRDLDLSPPGDADVAVVAGDMGGPLYEGVEAAARLTQGLPTIIVAGNHCYYPDEREQPRATWLQIKDRARQAASRHPHVHLLDDEGCVIDGVRFLGSTLWSDGVTGGRGYYDSAKASLYEMAHKMNDYRLIRTGPTTRHRLEVRDTRAAHARSVEWLRERLQDRSHPTVVVTHHAPDPGAGAHYTGLGQAYWSDLRWLIEECGPELWLYGHTHRARDEILGDTRVISNPLGYPREVTGFDVDLTIDVPGLEWRGPR